MQLGNLSQFWNLGENIHVLSTSQLTSTFVYFVDNTKMLSLVGDCIFQNRFSFNHGAMDALHLRFFLYLVAVMGYFNVPFLFN